MISNGKKYFQCLLLLLLAGTAHGIEQKQSLITVVKELHKQALYLPSEVAKPPVTSEQKQNLTLQVNLLTADQIVPMIYDLCEEHLKLESNSLTQTDSTFLTKMELFSGSQHKKESLLNHIDYTKTCFGKVLLALQLARPTYDITTLSLRQEIAKILIHDDALREKIDEQLTIMTEAEPHLLSYFEQDNAINEELFKNVYFGEWFNFLNTNAMALEGWTRLGNLGNIFLTALVPLQLLNAIAGSDYSHAEAIGKPISYSQSLLSTIKNIPNYIKALDPRLKAFKNKPYQQALKDYVAKKASTTSIYPQSLGDLLHKQNYIASLSSKHAAHIRRERTEIAFFAASTLAIQVCLTTVAIKNETLRRNIANYLQTKLIAVASYIKAAKTICELAHDNPVLCMIPGLHHIEKLANPNSSLSSDAKELLNLLDHNTFTGNASVFSLTGRVLAAHQLMKKVKYELIPSCAVASTFDVYSSAAKLYKKFEHSRVHYTFPKFVNNADMPYIATLAFWNPGVDANIVAANDVILGKDSPNNIILTGPNTGGKSTVIKSVLINLLLAQTIGIAPSDLLHFTPFAVLNCYLNITDDLSAGVSLFKAEVLRAKALIEAIRNLKAGQFSFTIMDEVFSGTSPKEGEEAAFMFAKELGNMPNSICSIATHFPKLTELEETEKFKNYQVKVWKDENNNWVRPFKLEEGKSTINIAMDLLEEAGIFSK